MSDVLTKGISTNSVRTNSSHRFPLSLAAKGSSLIVAEIPEGRARSQLIRLGIMLRETIRCIERLPGGTVVVEKSRQEIAIGATLAQTLLVEPTTTDRRDRNF